MARSIEPKPALTPAWAGNFTNNSWSTQWSPLVPVMAALRILEDGSWLKGHLGYQAVIEQYLYWHGTCMAFIYRDLRDVLVSQSYHVIAPDEKKYFHPDKELYRGMSHEDRLMACLCGVQQFSGLFERWELYAPWLSIPWVFNVKYEDMMERREETGRAFLHYVWDRTAWGYEAATIPADMEETIIKGMLKNMQRTELSATFRKGGSGGWREEFTPRVKDEFKRRGGDWLIRLGYEKDDSW